MKSFCVFLLLSFFLGVAVSSPAQEYSLRVGAGAVLPVERSFLEVEFIHRIAPRYSLALSSEIGADASNVSPKLAVDLIRGLGAEASFGWGHIWKKEGCDDHNFHTYGFGIVWSKRIGGRWSFYIGPSMYWRSHQGHIGFHKGTLRLVAGISFDAGRQVFIDK